MDTNEMKAKCISKDIISTLPSFLIENILCRVPIRDAVRTSILSRDWRYKWATIPKLVFHEDYMFDVSEEEQQLEQPENGRKNMTWMCKVFYAIHQVLFMHHGPILEFNLTMIAYKTCIEIDQIIVHLSRKNTVKKLTFDLECVHSFLTPFMYRFPLSIFSLHQLTDLSLSCCEFEFHPTFSGFSSLTSLSLIDVLTSRETVLHLISTSPLLKDLSLILGNPRKDEYVFTLAFNELFECLPVIEHLSISSWTIECFTPQGHPTPLVHLKNLSMYRMPLFNKIQLVSLFLLIRSSPNLETIEIGQPEFYDTHTNLMESEINSVDDYSYIWLEHLKELKIDNFTNSKLEMEFVKLVLASSPMLKKARIVLNHWFEKDEELKMLRILLLYPRASVVAKIIVERPEI